MDVIFKGVLESTKNAKNNNGKNYVRNEKFRGLLVIFSNNEKVNDETRGVLTYSQNNWFFISVPQYISLKSQKQIQRLVLLLESPHKDEYQNNQPIRPANGVTGAKIEALIASRAKNQWHLSTASDYEVVLVNAIQYQTSCYKLLGENWDYTNRNHVFKLLYNNFQLEDDLKQRLSAIKPHFIVNCVTSQLQSEVANVLLNFKPNICDIHPSAWK